MWKKISLWSIVLASLAVPSLAFANDVSPDSGLTDLLAAAVAAAKGGNYSVLVSVVIMLLVFLATKIPFIRDRFPKAALPVVAAVAGVLSSVAMTVLTTGDWLQALLGGLVTGAAASGLWEIVGKYVLGGQSVAPPADPSA